MNAHDAYHYLSHALREDRMAHAYVIAGPPRESGGELASRLLQLVFCQAETENKPCGRCQGCVQVQQRTHPDVLWVEPQMKSRKISVDQVRELQGRIFQTAYQGGWKACVIVGADRLGGEAANAFLKTLEEPPRNSLLLLLTDSPQSLISTLLSRCQKVSLDSEQMNCPDDWKERLVGILGETEASDPKRGADPVRILAAAESLVGFLEGIKKGIEREEKELAKAEVTEKDDDTLDARSSSRYREARAGIMRFILLWYRDRLLAAQGAEESLLVNRDRADLLKKAGRALTPSQALRTVGIVEAMNRQLERNIPESTVFSYGFIRMAS